MSVPLPPAARPRVDGNKILCPNGSWIFDYGNRGRITIHPGSPEEEHFDFDDCKKYHVANNTVKQALSSWKFEALFEEDAERPYWVQNIGFVICNDNQKCVHKAELKQGFRGYKFEELFDIYLDQDENPDTSWPWLLRNRLTGYVSESQVLPVDDGGHEVGVIVQDSRLLDFDSDCI